MTLSLSASFVLNVGRFATGKQFVCARLSVKGIVSRDWGCLQMILLGM